MKNVMLAVTMFLLLGSRLDMAYGAPVTRLVQDVKLPTQAVLERQIWSQPLASLTTYVVNEIAGPIDATKTTITTALTSPDVARNVEITPSGACSTSLNACSIDVFGTNYNGHSIFEDFVFSSNTCTKQIGTKAFKTVTSLVFSAGCEASPYNVKWDVGIGTKLGLKRCMTSTGDMSHGVAADVKEGTAPTMTSNVTSVELNTAIFNTAPDGTKFFKLYFIQDFQCF